MDANEAVLVCKANLEWPTKKVQYKLATIRLVRNDLREMFVEVGGFAGIFITIVLYINTFPKFQVSQEKMTTTKLKMKNINVHKKFAGDGKASIKFNNDGCMLYMSNCPPGSLLLFLKNLYIKMVNDQTKEKELTKEELKKKINAHIYSEKPNAFEDISPVTNLELARAKKQALPKSTLTTPSPPANKKRKLTDITQRDGGAQPGPAKKLYAPNITPPLAKKIETRIENPNDPALMCELNDEQNQVLQGEWL